MWTFHPQTPCSEEVKKGRRSREMRTDLFACGASLGLLALEREEVQHGLWKQGQTQSRRWGSPSSAPAGFCQFVSTALLHQPKVLPAHRSPFLSPDRLLLWNSPWNRATQRQQRHQINHSFPASPPFLPTQMAKVSLLFKKKKIQTAKKGLSERDRGKAKEKERFRQQATNKHHQS